MKQMNPEKYVKQKARAALNGNFSKQIAAMGAVFGSFVLVEILQSVCLLLWQNVDLDTGKVLNPENIIYYAIIAGTIVAYILISPLVNGYLRTAATTAVNGDCDALDAFYYFRGARRYFKTLAVNALIYVLFAFSSGIFNLTTYLSILFPDWYEGGLTFSPESAIVVAAAVVSFIAQLLAYMLFAHYPLMAYALDEGMPVSQCVFGTLRFSFKNFGKLFRLMLSFAGWFALCFFVVPALYVVPYFFTSAALSANWLFELDRRGGAR